MPSASTSPRADSWSASSTPRGATAGELQLLADEVGMGKVFFIVTPHNQALFSKWGREVGEFVRRCVLPEYQPSARSWFRPVTVERLDDLVVALRKPGGGGSVIVVKTGIFGEQKLKHYDLKRRFTLGCSSDTGATASTSRRGNGSSRGRLPTGRATPMR